jgi:hypothetical protein
VLLLVFASLGVLVAEDEVNLVGSSTLVGTEHDDIGSAVRELLLVELLILLEELEVSTTANKGVYNKRRLACEQSNRFRCQLLTLRLDLVLNHQGFALVVNLLGELGRDGVVGGSVLDHKTLVAINTLQDSRLFNGPFTNVSPFVVGLGVILLRSGSLPPRLPVVGELLQEGSLEGGGLTKKKTISTYVYYRESAFNCDIP